MTARVVAVLTLAASIGLLTPWMGREPAAVAAPVDAAVSGGGLPQAYDDSLGGLHGAVEAAVQAHVPGVAGNHWELHRLDRSEPDADGVRRVVANGIIASPGAPGTGVRLTGRYDPATGALTQVGYRLQPSVRRAAPLQGGGRASAWSVETAVRQALSEALPGQDVRFALDSAQATRLDDGGRRFEGAGIGTWGSGAARFVAFTLVLSEDGQPVAFDYGAEAAEGEAAMIAGH